MNLLYLDFDYSEDTDGNGTFDAMASAAPLQWSALQAEVHAVLAWAHAHFPGACGAAEDGGEWQYDLQGLQEVSTPMNLVFDTESGRLHVAPGVSAPPRTTVSVSVSGSAHFCGALREAFKLD